MSPETAPETSVATVKPRLNLEFIDGIRALCALYVVFCHSSSTIADNTNIPPLGRPLSFLVKFEYYGHDAVVVFIVLSGYCLMLPIARSGVSKLSGGLVEYFRRRSVRILPPYYAALALSLFLIWITPGLQEKGGRFWDSALPALTPGVILSHIFLVHDLSFDWFARINPPMWSIAVEWHIYFLFPLLLLLYRRWGIVASLVASFGIWQLTRFLIHGYAHPHFIVLFTYGMAASVFSFQQGEVWDKWRRKVPWGILSAILLLVMGASAVMKSANADGGRFIMVDVVLLGPLAAVFLVYCATKVHLSTVPSKNAEGENTQGEIPARRGILGFLEMPWLVSLGLFSYSIYLVHMPLQSLAFLFIPQTLSPAVQYLIMLLLVSPLCVLAAYGFHRVFEKPFMINRTKPKKTDTPA